MFRRKLGVGMIHRRLYSKMDHKSLTVVVKVEEVLTEDAAVKVPDLPIEASEAEEEAVYRIKVEETPTKDVAVKALELPIEVLEAEVEEASTKGSSDTVPVKEGTMASVDTEDTTNDEGNSIKGRTMDREDTDRTLTEVCRFST